MVHGMFGKVERNQMEWREHCAGMAAAGERTDAEVEKTFTDTLGDLAKDRFGTGGAEQIREAAGQSIKRLEKNKALNDAVKGRT